MTHQEIEHQLQTLKRRNKKVEKDKAWETSYTRKLCIAGLTYAIAVAYLSFLGVAQPFLNAIVPTGGFLLSTLSLQIMRRVWERHYKG